MNTEAPPAASQLWTVKQACDLLGVGHDKIYRLMRSGALAWIDLPPGTKRSPRRIEQREIERFLDANRRGGSTP
jgi:excisionase family DNA binding protein